MRGYPDNPSFRRLWRIVVNHFRDRFAPASAAHTVLLDNGHPQHRPLRMFIGDQR